MKGETDFLLGILGPRVVATKPIGEMKYMDWERARKICEAAIAENPDVIISAGLMEDWTNTSGKIYEDGKYTRGYVYGSSCWATPIVDVDGVEYECWTYDKPNGWTTGVPGWWTKKNGANDG